MWDWLNREWKMRMFVPATAILVVGYMTWCTALYYLGLIPAELYEGAEQIVIDGDVWFWIFLFEAALVEEMLFRAPLSFVVRALKYPAVVSLAVIGLSVVFGYIHQFSWWSVPVQGVFGLLISIMYLKFGGAQGKFLKPLFCASIAHFISNATLFLVQDYFANI